MLGHRTRLGAQGILMFKRIPSVESTSSGRVVGGTLEGWKLRFLDTVGIGGPGTLGLWGEGELRIQRLRGSSESGPWSLRRASPAPRIANPGSQFTMRRLASVVRGPASPISCGAGTVLQVAAVLARACKVFV